MHFTTYLFIQIIATQRSVVLYEPSIPSAKLYRALKDLKEINIDINDIDVPENIMEALCDDLNTPKALAELNSLVNNISKVSQNEKKIIKKQIISTGKLIGILQNNPEKWLGYGHSERLDSETIEGLIKNRNEARRNKNFDLADSIRKELKSKGIEIEDTKNGTVWRSNE